MGTNARPALPRLLGMLATTNYGAAVGAILALGELKLEPHLVVPALTNCLLGPVTGLRFFAAQALGRYGSEACSAVPALVRALDDSSAVVGRCATNALRAIDPQALGQAHNHRERKDAE